MPVAKKEEAAHDCKKDCELLHKEIAALKKEVAALKAELKKAPKGGGGADPRVDKLIEVLKDNPKFFLSKAFLN
jgi:uncharacterized small protein (DUF1192 family)